MITASSWMTSNFFQSHLPSLFGGYFFLAMILAFRSHPCVSLWTLQNETSPDVNNPRMRYALEKIREGKQEGSARQP